MWWDCATHWPLAESAAQALQAGYRDGWAATDAPHREGRQASLLAHSARQHLGQTLNCAPENVFFSTSPQQAICDTLNGILAPFSNQKCGFIHSAIEQATVLHYAEQATANGRFTASIPVSSSGHVDAKQLAGLLAEADGHIRAVVVQWVNGEIGTVQDLQALHAVTTEADVPLVVDATAGIGYLPLPEHWDLLWAPATAWGGPAATTVVLRRGNVRYSPSMAEQHSPVVPAHALAAAVSLQQVCSRRSTYAAAARTAITTIGERILSQVRDVDIASDPTNGAPHILTASFLYCPGERLAERLDAAGFAVGSGSACASARLEPSHVLAATGRLTHGNIRIGIPARYSVDQLREATDRFCTELPQVVADTRQSLGIPASDSFNPAPDGATAQSSHAAAAPVTTSVASAPDQQDSGYAPQEPHV